MPTSASATHVQVNVCLFLTRDNLDTWAWHARGADHEEGQHRVGHKVTPGRPGHHLRMRILACLLVQNHPPSECTQCGDIPMVRSPEDCLSIFYASTGGLIHAGIVYCPNSGSSTAFDAPKGAHLGQRCKHEIVAANGLIGCARCEEVRHDAGLHRREHR